MRLLFAAVFQSDPPPGNQWMVNHLKMSFECSVNLLGEIYFTFSSVLSTRHSTLGPLHLINLFARASTSGGIVRPICFAVLRFITSSNFIGR